MINHHLESWTFANATARNAAGTYVAGDVGRVSYQSDTGQYWRLMTTTPTWAIISGSVYASYQSGQLNPTGTAAVFPGVMMGLSGTITPSASGKIAITIAGYLSNSAAGGAQAAIRYGTGTAPVNGAADTGTASGGGAARGVIGAGVAAPFSLSCLATGLSIGVPLWIDLIVAQSIGGTSSAAAVAITAFELP